MKNTTSIEHAVHVYFENPEKYKTYKRCSESSFSLVPVAASQARTPSSHSTTLTTFEPRTGPKPIIKNSHCLYLGRRVVLGYTLCRGAALREHHLDFNLEGLQSSHQSKKKKFSGANLLFESKNISGRGILNGRLPNWLCKYCISLLIT